MFLSRNDVREIDRLAEANGLPTRVLMENAGRGAAEVLLRLGIPGPVLVCCGKGNNGGDGLVVARHLLSWKIDVRVALFAKDLAGAPAENLHALGRPVLQYTDYSLFAAECGRAAWIVDALFGIGLASPVRPPFDRVIETMNDAAPIFAIDVPSGLDADTGEPLGPTILARHTATFVAEKKGFANPAARKYTGRVHVVDLGLPASPATASG